MFAAHTDNMSLAATFLLIPPLFANLTAAAPFHYRSNLPNTNPPPLPPKDQRHFPPHRTQGELPINPEHAVYWKKIGQVSPSLGYVTAAFTLDVAQTIKAADEAKLQGARMAKMLTSNRTWTKEELKESPIIAANASLSQMATLSLLRDQDDPDHHNAKWRNQIADALLQLADDAEAMESATAALGYDPQEQHQREQSAWDIMRDTRYPLHQRITRALPALLLATGAIVSTVMGLFTQAQLMDLRKKINKSEATMAFRIKAVEMSNQAENRQQWRALKDLAAFGKWSMHATAAEGAIRAVARGQRRVRDIATAAVHHRLSTQAMSKKEAQQTFQEVQREAAKFGFHPMIESPAHLFQCQVSYMATVDGLLTIFLHVPVTADNPMDMYSYMPMPVFHGNDLLTITTSTTFFATAPAGHPTSYRAFTTDQMITCARQQDLFLCPDANVVANHQPTVNSPAHPEYCLYALFNRNWEVAFATCHISYQTPAEAAFQVGPNDFVTYSDRPSKGDITCTAPEASRHSDWQLSKRAHVNIQPGCKGRTGTHTLTAALNQRLDAHTIKSYSWPKSYNHIFDQAAEDIKLVQAANNMAQDPLAAITFRQLTAKKAREQILGKEFWLHPRATAAISVTGTLLLLSLLLVGLYILCAVRRYRLNLKYKYMRVTGNTPDEDDRVPLTGKKQDLEEWFTALDRALADPSSRGQKVGQLLLHLPRAPKTVTTDEPKFFKFVWPDVPASQNEAPLEEAKQVELYQQAPMLVHHQPQQQQLQHQAQQQLQQQAPPQAPPPQQQPPIQLVNIPPPDQQAPQGQ